MKNIIFLSRNDIAYKGVTYDIDYFLQNIINKKKRNIIILGEDIYIKIHSVNGREELKKDNINLLVKRYFGDFNDYLINYEVSKDKKNIYIYAIRGGSYLERLCKAPIVVNVVPIQVDVVKICNKVIKKRDYVYIFKYKNFYYCIKVNDGYLIEGAVKNHLEEIKNILNSKDDIYIDNEIEDNIKGNKINIKERSIYNEKVC